MPTKIGWCAFALLLACGDVKSTEVPDAGAPARPVAEIGAASGRLRGGPYRLDVQVGHSWDQAPAAGGAMTVRGGAPVAP